MIFILFLFSFIYQEAYGAGPDIKIEPQVLIITRRMLTVTLTCTYVTGSRQGASPVWRMNGAIIPYRETREETVNGIHYSNISRPTSQFSNDTSLTCSIANGHYVARTKVYVLDYVRLNGVGLLSPIYPSEETAPLLICWTPPLVYYTMAYIVGYHINSTDSTGNNTYMGQHMFVGNETLCWELTGFGNTTTLFSIAAEYVAGLGQTRQILVSPPASTYSPTSSWDISVEYNRSNESSELYDLTIKWKLNYQWLPQYYHIDLVCQSKFEMREKIKGITEYTASDKRLVENDLCTISIVACLKEDQGTTDSAMCLWKAESQLHNFTVVLVATPTATMNPTTVETSTAFETPSNAELYIGMAATLFVVGSIAIVTGIIACVFWRRRTQSSRHVGGGSGVQYNPYDHEVIISTTDDGNGLAEDVGYMAMKSEKCTNQPGERVTCTPNFEEPAYAEIPVKLELGSKWTT